MTDENDIALEQQRAQDERRATQYNEDIRWLMGHKEGRRILYSILERGRVFQCVYRHSNEMLFSEGGRNLALSYQIDVFRNDLEELYFKMLKEAKDPV